MALFSGLFDPGTYGDSSSGSLIDRLLAQLGTQQQYQPSAGFAPNPMDANAAMPNNPISVGNYQMPRIGSGFDTLPRQTDDERAAGQLPAAVQPVAQPQPAAPQLPVAQNTPGGFSGAMRGALANMQGGPLGMLGGAIAGGMGMGQGSDIDRANASVVQNYRALLAAGVPQQKAVLAAISPEAAKSILADQFGGGNYSVAQTGENDLGGKTYSVFNKKDGSFTPITGQAATTGNNGGGLGDMNLTGADYLATLPKAQANTVQMMVEGKMAPPTSMAISKPYWQKMIAAAKNYDPTFDATAWAGRVAGVKDFSAGKSSEMVRSANQTLHHVGQLLDSMDNLKNTDYPLENYIGNAINEKVYGTGEQGAFRTNAHAVAEELSKVFKGSNLSDAEIKTWESNLSENMSPAQQRAQIAKLRDLLQGSLQALEEKRLNSIGPIAAEKQGPLIKEEGQQVLARINTWLKNNGSAAAPTLQPGQSTTMNGVAIRRVQ